MKPTDIFFADNPKYNGLSDKTAVFIQCGIFCETFAIENDLKKIREISNILNCSVTKYNKHDSNSNIYYLGFPITAINSKFKQLQDAGPLESRIDSLGNSVEYILVIMKEYYHQMESTHRAEIYYPQK